MEINEHIAGRVRDRVRRMPGLEDVVLEQVLAVARGEDIEDPFATVAITSEIEEYGFEVRRP